MNIEIWVVYLWWRPTLWSRDGVYIIQMYAAMLLCYCYSLQPCWSLLPVLSLVGLHLRKPVWSRAYESCVYAAHWSADTDRYRGCRDCRLPRNVDPIKTRRAWAVGTLSQTSPQWLAVSRLTMSPDKLGGASAVQWVKGRVGGLSLLHWATGAAVSWILCRRRARSDLLTILASQHCKFMRCCCTTQTSAERMPTDCRYISSRLL